MRAEGGSAKTQNFHGRLAESNNWTWPSPAQAKNSSNEASKQLFIFFPRVFLGRKQNTEPSGEKKGSSCNFLPRLSLFRSLISPLIDIGLLQHDTQFSARWFISLATHFLFWSNVSAHPNFLADFSPYPSSANDLDAQSQLKYHKKLIVGWLLLKMSPSI